MEELKEKIAAEIGRAIGRSSAMGNLVSPMTLFYATAALRAIEEAGFAVVPREANDEMINDPLARCYNTGPYGAAEVRRIYRTMVNLAHPLEAYERAKLGLSPLNLEEPRG